MSTLRCNRLARALLHSTARTLSLDASRAATNAYDLSIGGEGFCFGNTLKDSWYLYLKQGKHSLPATLNFQVRLSILVLAQLFLNSYFQLSYVL